MICQALKIVIFLAMLLLDLSSSHDDHLANYFPELENVGAAHCDVGRHRNKIYEIHLR